ncbi:hypothetical protein AB0M57_11860 [Streptomyces sp. NPDC051597]|uniref:hypothetical protein n=1 Tax=Streptomyces sp. NPDC051597 TaxID=3155049 RepID=UPI0034145635
MRNALRTALATAVVAGVALTPVVTATTALAAPSVSAPAAANPLLDPYDGQKVLVHKQGKLGVLAVLRNEAEGPEVWIRAVGADWTPSRGWGGHVYAVLDRDTLSATVPDVKGLKLQLLGASGAAPVLKVTSPTGAVSTYALPKASKDEFLRDQTLKGGLHAKVYRGGVQRKYYVATVLKGTKVLGTLTAGGDFADKRTAVFDGIQVTLDSHGALTSVRAANGGGQDLGRRKLADGTYAELRKMDANWYVLELEASKGKERGSITAGGPGGAAENGRQVGGMWVGLNSVGKVGSWLNPAGGFDGDVDYTKGCTAFRTSGTPFKGLSLRLSSGPKGSVAEVTNVNDGSVYDRLSTGDRYGLLGGAEVQDLPSGPVFRMHVHGGKSPWATIRFPKKPAGAGCAVTTGTTNTTGTGSHTATGTGTTAQTGATGVQVVPRGAVAAGAEIKGGGKDDNTVLVAGGAGLASVGAAGLGFVALRRRADARG